MSLVWIRISMFIARMARRHFGNFSRNTYCERNKRRTNNPQKAQTRSEVGVSLRACVYCGLSATSRAPGVQSPILLYFQSNPKK